MTYINEDLINNFNLNSKQLSPHNYDNWLNYCDENNISEVATNKKINQSFNSNNISSLSYCSNFNSNTLPAKYNLNNINYMYGQNTNKIEPINVDEFLKELFSKDHSKEYFNLEYEVYNSFKMNYDFLKSLRMNSKSNDVSVCSDNSYLGITTDNTEKNNNKFYDLTINNKQQF